MKNLPCNLTKLASIFPCKLYIVGGFVRNSFAGGKDTDIDLCGAIPAEGLSLPDGYSVIPVNKRLGTALICTDGEKYEYTPFRAEIYPEGGAHTPLEVTFTDDIFTDSKRRDFTVNSIYYDIAENKTIDFFDGIGDIKRKVIRAVVSPEHVFSSDGLRIMRLIRQSAEMGYGIEIGTFETAKRLAGLLRDISKERIRTELDKILIADTKYNVHDAHYRGLSLIGALGVWKYIIPEVCEMAGVAQNPAYHRYDVYEHSLQCVRFAPPAIRLAALLHDIGKPASIKKIGKMYEHVTLGEALAKNILGAHGLKYSNSEINRTVRLIAGHMYNRDGKAGKNKLRRFVVKNNDILDDLTELIKADSLAKGFDSEDGQIPNYQQFIDTRNEMLEKNIPFSLRELEVNGEDLAAIGITGAEIGRVLEELFCGCLYSRYENKREILLREARLC